MPKKEIKKATVFNTESEIEYITDSIVVKTIIRKITGNIVAMSFDTGKCMKKNVSPFDTFIQIIDGKAEIHINGTSYLLTKGNCIVIPAHSSNEIKPGVKFKLIITLIKSGYE
jgi:quercetin dioxygenase-like cupin family protein